MFFGKLGTLSKNENTVVGVDTKPLIVVKFYSLKFSPILALIPKLNVLTPHPYPFLLLITHSSNVLCNFLIIQHLCRLFNSVSDQENESSLPVHKMSVHISELRQNVSTSFC